MTQAIWNKLTLFEQMSNIDGDVERMIRSHEKFLSGESDKDYGWFYFENIRKLVKMIILDDKNRNRAYIAVELFDEVELLREYMSGNYPAESIRSYWQEYTKAIS